MPRYVADHVADAAKGALLEELETWPKPGLVSHVDSGSHTDMDASTLRASATAITPFYYQLTVAGAAESGTNRLREIGLEAERAMLAATTLCGCRRHMVPDDAFPIALASQTVRRDRAPAVGARDNERTDPAA